MARFSASVDHAQLYDELLYSFGKVSFSITFFPFEAVERVDLPINTKRLHVGGTLHPLLTYCKSNILQYYVSMGIKSRGSHAPVDNL